MSTEIDADGWRALLQSRRAQPQTKTPLGHLQKVGQDDRTGLDGTSWKKHLEAQRDSTRHQPESALGRSSRARQVGESMDHAKENFVRTVSGRIPSSQEPEQAQPSRLPSVNVGLEASPSTAKNDERIAKHFLKKRKASPEEATGRTQGKHWRGLDR